jgi:transcriptional regulator with XRE-family HTH domain
MNAVLAKNVRTLRDMKHWTQQHLAETAGILLRTVQRVEKGDGASLETLGALSNAFDVSIDVLQTDVEALMEQVRQQQEALRKTHDFIAVTPVTCSAHLESVGDADGSVMECVSTDDAVRDGFAALKANLRDMIDIWDDVDPAHHRDWAKAAYGQVEELNRLGIVVCIGKANRVFRTGAGTINMDTLYVVAWPKGEEKPFVAVEKAS